MGSLLVYVESSEGQFTTGSLGVAAKAAALAGELSTSVTAVVVGPGASERAATLGSHGVGRVLAVDGARGDEPSATEVADAVVAAVRAESPLLVMANASVLGAEVAGLVAGRLGLGIATDAVDASISDGSVIVTKPAFDDSVWVECGWAGEGETAGVALFRAGSFSADPVNGATAEVVGIEPEGSERHVEFLGRAESTDEGVDITQADVLVGAGRGLGGPDQFGVVESLAQALGGAVATTRAVVDAGWYDYSTQVGQTGKTVAPKLYIAAGISGAIQHKIGMQSSGTIVAINKDANAPIFEYADFGVVGDLFEVLPKLEQAIRESS